MELNLAVGWSLEFWILEKRAKVESGEICETKRELLKLCNYGKPFN